MSALLVAAVFAGAAVTEIAGSFAFWAWLRLDKSVFWVAPGIVSLIIFALLLTRIETAFAGRAFAAYGGVYIAASILWLWLIEGVRPDRWDLTGGVICIIGAMVIIFGPRAAV